MNYRHLGASGLRVSEIALGSWLTYGGTVEDDSAVACIHRAFEQGVNFFDTANVSRRGEAEKVVGRALAGIDRDDYVLATKVYFPMGEAPTIAASRASTTWSSATARSSGSAWTTWTSINAIGPTPTHRWWKPCAHSRTSSGRARLCTWGSPNGPPNCSTRHAASSASAVGTHSCQTSRSTRCSTARSRPTSSRCPSSWE